MVEIDIERAELVFKNMQDSRDREYPNLSKDEKLLSDRKIMDAVLKGARAYERKRLDRQKRLSQMA
jgi:hypothetical protein